MSDGDTILYSSKIIRAGALLPDAKTILAHWDETVDTKTNLRRIQMENLLGKASRSRVEEILVAMRQRYLAAPDLAAGLAVLAKAGMPASFLDPVLYFLAAQADPLIRGAVIEVLVLLATQGRREILANEMLAWVMRQVAEGRTQGQWSDSTVRRVVQGLMSTLRDFGVLQGAVKKQLAPMYLPPAAFAFIAFLLHRQNPAGDRLLHSPEWQLFFLTPQGVERRFLEAHQERLLEYHAAGRVIRVEFPVQTVEGYAHALAQRPS